MANEVPWPLLQWLIGARSRGFSPTEPPPAPAVVQTFPYADLDVTVLVYLGADPTADPSTWPEPVDMSARLTDDPITMTLGRPQGQRTLASGSCSFTLHNEAIPDSDGLGANAAGALSPLLASSAFFGDWDLGVPVKLLVDNVGADPPYSLFCGFAASIEQSIIPGVGGTTLSVVKVTLGGVVRQRSQGAVARSGLNRTILGSDPTLYWALSGGTLTEAFAPTAGDGDRIVIGTGPFAGSGVEPGNSLATWLDDGVRLYDANVLEQQVLLAGINGAISATPTRLVMDLTFVINTDTTLVSYSLLTDALSRLVGTGVQVSIYYDPSGGTPTLYVAVNDYGAAFFDSGSAALTLTTGVPHHMRLDLQDNGANVDARGYIDGALIVSHTFSGFQLTQYNFIEMMAGAATGDTEAVVSSAVVWEGTPGNLGNMAAAATTGYAGEAAHVRVQRVCLEEGIICQTSAIRGQLCGVQPIADVLAVLRDIELVDHGMLTELTTTWGLGYLSGTERYNLDAAMTIDLDTYRVTGGGFSGDVLTPVRNDQRIRNEWTISRPDGGEATDKDAANQALRGRFNDSAEVNAYSDDQLLDEASWRVHEGTFGGLRYRSMPLDLGANNGGSDGSSDLLGAWLALALGARIDRNNYPDTHPADTASVTLEGYTQALTRRSWVAAPVVEPFDPWVVGVYAGTSEVPGPAEPKRYSPVDSQVNSSFAANTGTSLSVAGASSDDLWSTTADFPFDIRLAPVGVTSGGVRSRVTAIGAPSGLVQTFTVEAATVNGVARTVPAGWAVTLWQPAVRAL